MKEQFFRFIIVGVYSTIINYGVFLFVYKFLDVNYLIASAVGFLTGVLASYPFNRNWTFAVKNKRCSFLFRYYGVYVVSLFLGLWLLDVLVEMVGILPVFANVVTIGFTTCSNFIGTKFFVFKS